jgi:Domain of unknown function (DUF4397)
VKLRSLLVATAAAILPLAVVGPVYAQTTTVPAAGSGTAKVRIAHFSPDAPNVDVYINGQKVLANVQYDKHSQYLDVPAKAGALVEVRATGAAADSKPAISVNADFAAGKNYTVAAIGKLATIQGKIYEDDVTAPPEGKVKLRIIHAAPDVKPVDVVVKQGTSLATKLAFPDATPYLTLDPGTYAVQVVESGTKTPVVANDVILVSGGVYTVAAIGGGDKSPKLKGLIDLASKNAAPTTLAAGAQTDADTTPTTVAETTAATTVADTTVTTDAAVTTESIPDTTPETTTPDTTTPDTTTPGDTVAPPDTTPAGGVPSGGGGLAGGGALGATALLGASAAVLAVAAHRRRSAR